jgi:ribosomal protein L2
MNQSQSASFAAKARQKSRSKNVDKKEFIKDELAKIQGKIETLSNVIEKAKEEEKKRSVVGTPLLLDTIPEGTKVRINVDRIFAQKDFADLQPRYRKFVQEARGKVYTVEYDPERRDRPSEVCLAEDKSEIKWRWHVSDLEVVA